MGRGTEGGYIAAPTAGILLPSPTAWEASREKKPCVNLQHSETIPKLNSQKGSDSSGEVVCAVIMKGSTVRAALPREAEGSSWKLPSTI